MHLQIKCRSLAVFYCHKARMKLNQYVKLDGVVTRSGKWVLDYIKSVSYPIGILSVDFFAA